MVTIRVFFMDGDSADFTGADLQECLAQVDHRLVVDLGSEIDHWEVVDS